MSNSLRQRIRGLAAALLLVVALSSASEGARAQGAPVSYWPANGNATDVTGGNDGLLSGSVSYTTGVRGEAWQFTGGNGRVSVADAPNLQITSSLTISGWVNVTAFPSAAQGYAVILARIDDTGYAPYLLAVDSNGHLYFQIASGTAYHYVYASIPRGRFIYVQALLDGDTGRMALLVDGVLLRSDTTTVRPGGALSAANNPGVGIGNVPDASAAAQLPFNGILDEMQIYNQEQDPVGAMRDANGDGEPDLWWFNTRTQGFSTWLLDGTSILSTGTLPSSSPLWRPAAIVDLNGDGTPDILWQNVTNGAIVFWLMSGSRKYSSGYVSYGGDANEVLVTTADLNGDGHPDLILQDKATGVVTAWLMNGTQRIGTATLSTGVDPSWNVVAAADLNGDGSPDLIWQNSTTGGVVYWLMDGLTRTQSGFISAGNNPAWQIVGTADLQADGQPDLIWHNTQNGAVVYWILNGLTHTGGGYISTGTDTDWVPISR
ncbi:MAG: VCBS repeat-containing protein [Armatimonadetes bacterium]|nr:VCBS repeat-containing protein [Armatimonadota bacterium]MDE2205048.1 VCBS repeat-containing protein [Armatimonadota bacterium]